MKISRSLILILFLFLSSLFSVTQAKLSITLSKTEVRLGETVDLIIDYDNAQKDNLKFPLHTTNYDVIGEASSSSVNIINGKVKQKKKSLHYQFKQLGQITLPISEIKSNSQIQANSNYTINVLSANSHNNNNSSQKANNTKSSQSSPQKMSNLFARLELSNNKPYVNEQILLKLKIYHLGNLKNISLPELSLDDFIHKRLENDTKEYQEVFNGHRYMVYEIPYLIFPIKAGNNYIPSTEIDLITIGRPAQIDPFDPFMSFSRAFNQEKYS